jgi:cell division protein FtsZ
MFQPDFHSEPNQPNKLNNIIKVIGVGGGGGNAVNHMYREGIEGVDFFICNTDNQALRHSPVPNKIQLGNELTAGLGAGSDPNMGAKAAEESKADIQRMLGDGTRMIFLTAGMGGGTGTGAVPIIAKFAKEMGILTVGIVTIPFSDEGPVRIKQAQQGIADLKPHVDALISISNDRIVDMFGDLSFLEAFSKADDVLCTAARGIAEIIFKTGHLNVDFNDVKTAMQGSGQALMGTGTAAGENRAELAVRAALNSPLLDSTRIFGAKHLLINLTYGTKAPTMSETRIITSYLQEEAGNNALLKMGITLEPTLEDKISVTVIATGFEEVTAVQKEVYTDQLIEEVAQTQTFVPTELPLEIEDASFETPSREPAREPAREPMVAKTEPVMESKPVTVKENINTPSLEDLFKTQSNRNSQLHLNYQQPAVQSLSRENKASIHDNDMDIPAYLRRNVELVSAPPSSAVEVSRLTIQGAETQSKDNNFTVQPNRMLHDNVD